MAYATKYLFKWESVNGTTREIRVLLDGYSGSVIQRRLGRAPVLKKQHNGNVYGTSLEFYAECTVDGEFAEFYTSDPKAYRVDLYTGSTLLWQGYITPELYSEPDIAPPYDVQVVATDGIGELKLYDFVPMGTVTLRALLGQLLGYTGLTTDVYLISSIKPGGSGAAGSLLEKSINLDYKAGETCYEVLSYLLDTLHATITWWKGAWILARETNVKFSSGKVQYFNTSGNAGTLAGSVVTLGKMYTNDAWPVGQLTTKIDPAKNSVRIQAPWHPVTALQNSDMTSDSSWTKVNDAAYDSTNKCYHLPATGLTTVPRISQSLSLSALKNPMALSGKFTGVSADLPLALTFAAKVGFYVTYEVSGTTYHIERTDDGIVWKQGAAPTVFNYLNCIYASLECFDEDEVGAQELSLEIPPFVSGSSFPAGTLTVMVFGGCARVFSTTLDVVISKGYQDNLYLDNGARGEGSEIEIAIGRETAAVASSQNFLQGLLLDSGSLITSFKDDYITASGLDWMSFIARDYARSYALPRLVRTGTVSLESAVTFPPLVFTKGAVDYWLEGYSWNMLDDELEISARSLPTATITVDSEVITEAGGTVSSSASQGSGSSGGGGGFAPGGINYLETNASLETLVQLKSAYSYFGPKKGLIFDTVPEADVASCPAHLMLRNVGTTESPKYALYTPYSLITAGDQIIGSGTPGGGGGGGVSNLYELNDVSVPHPYSTSHPADGDALVWDNANSRWTNKPVGTIMPAVTSLGGVDGDITLGTGLSINGQVLSVTANTYLPLAGGTMSNTNLVTNMNADLLDGKHDGELTAKYLYRKYAGSDASQATLSKDCVTYDILDGTSDTELLKIDRYGQVVSLGMSWVGATFGYRLLYGVNSGEIGYQPRGSGNWGSVYKFYHSGNSNKSDVDWTCRLLNSTGTTSAWAGTFTSGSGDSCVYISYGKYGEAIVSKDNTSSSYLLSCMYGATSLSGSGASSALYVRCDGNVGIGTESPSYKLHVAGSLSAYSVTFANTTSYGVRNGSGVLYLGSDGTNLLLGYGLASTAGGTYIDAGTGGIYMRVGSYTTAAFINSSANFGIGTTSPSARLHVETTSSSASAEAFTITQPNLPTSGMCILKFGKNLATRNMGQLIYYHVGDGSTSNKLYFGFYNAWSLSYLDAAGNFVTTGDQVISSDERKKKNLAPIELTVDQIAACRAVTYDRIDTGLHSLGVIAQDWEKILPESVIGGEFLEFKYAQTAMVAGIINARAIVDIQSHETEQDRRIEFLEDEVKRQNTEILRLKARLNLS